MYAHHLQGFVHNNCPVKLDFLTSTIIEAIEVCFKVKAFCDEDKKVMDILRIAKDIQYCMENCERDGFFSKNYENIEKQNQQNKKSYKEDFNQTPARKINLENRKLSNNENKDNEVPYDKSSPNNSRLNSGLYPTKSHGVTKSSVKSKLMSTKSRVYESLESEVDSEVDSSNSDSKFVTLNSGSSTKGLIKIKKNLKQYKTINYGHLKRYSP